MDVKRRNNIIAYSALGILLSVGVYFGYGAYKKSKAGKGGAVVGLDQLSRNQAIKVIEDYTGKKFQNANSYETAYLVVRAQAIKLGVATFPYNNKTYNTNTGKSV